MTPGNCLACAYFVADGVHGGLCHRNPPQFMMEQTDPQNREYFVSGWYHPWVANADWCGEYKAR